MIVPNPEYQQAKKRLKRPPFWLKETVEIPTLTSRSLKAHSETTIDLYPNQREAYNEMKDVSHALLEAPTSFGKTVLMCALHQAVGGKTMIAIHNNVMVEQIRGEFEKFTGIIPTNYCSGEKDASGEVVIVSYNTLRDVPDILDMVTTLIIDECDIFFSKRAIEVLTTAQVPRIYGLTGTAKTIYDEYIDMPDGVLGTFYGNKIVKKSDKPNPLKAIYYRKRITHYIDELGNPILPHSWHMFREHLDSDIARKRDQIQYLLENTNGTEPTLILLDRVADVNAWYASLIQRGKTAYKQHGEMKAREREEHLAQFKKTGGYLVGQTKTLERGYNNTHLVKAFIFFPINAKGRGENVLRQIIGRIIRHFDGKEAYLYLWRDSALEYQWKHTYRVLSEFFSDIEIKSL